MWSLTSEVTGAVKYLWKGRELTIGRKNTDVVISDDSSISRNHAKIFVKDDISLMLVDLKSKYGTFYNNERVQPEIEINIVGETTIKFGQINSTFRVKKIVISIATSNINSNDRKELLKNIEFLNGKFMSDWSRDCTHLTISVVKLTLKVLCALTLGQPIVNIKYWSDFVERVKNDNDLPDPSDYLPKVSETLLSTNVSLVYDPSRKTLFSNKTFVFFTERTIKNTKDAILVCGGEAVLWKDAQYDPSWLMSQKPEYIFIEENPRNASQTDVYKTFYEAVASLESLGKRTITLQEIALAILNRSCEKDCNPNFNRIANIKPKETKLENLKLLAKETQNTQSSAGSEVIINESAGCSMNFDSQCHTIYTETIEEGSKNLNKRPVDEPDATVVRKRLKQDVELQKTEPLVLEKVKQPEQQTKLNISQISTISTKASSLKTTYFQNPFMIKKRKAESEIEKPIKKPPQPIEVEKKKTLEKVLKKKTEKSKQIPSNQKPTVVTIDFEWTSKSVMKMKNKEEETNEVQIKKEVDDRDIEKLLWIESMKDKTIVMLDKNLEVSRRTANVSSSSVNEQKKSTKNFKRFQKTKHKHIQSFVVPTEEYKIIICGRDFYNEHPMDENEYESDNEFNDVAVHKPSTSLNITRASTTSNASMNTTSASKKRKYDFFLKNAKN